MSQAVKVLKPNAQPLIQAAFDTLHFSVIDSGQDGNVMAVSMDGAFTSVRPTRLNSMQDGDTWGVLISVETTITLDNLRKAGLIAMLQSAGAMLSGCATAIGGDAHGRILLHRVLAMQHLTSETLAAEIVSTQHLRRLMDASPEGSDPLT